MSRVSYVPYSQDYADLFAYCGIALATEDFGGNQGWYADDFAQAAVQAQDYLNENLTDENADTFEYYFGLLENYNIFYWSTEAPIVG